MSKPVVSVTVDADNNIVLHDSVGSPVTTTTPVTLTLPHSHRWASLVDSAAVQRDMIVKALVWLQGRHVDQSTMTSGNKVTPTLGGQTAIYSGVAGDGTL